MAGQVTDDQGQPVPVRGKPGYFAHEPTGWIVDSRTGLVYSPWREGNSLENKPLGGVDGRGNLRAARNDRFHGTKRWWPLRQVVWEAVNGRLLPEGYSVQIINGDKLDMRPENLRAVPKGRVMLRKHTHKLNDAEVQAIREARGVLTRDALAARYGIRPDHVSRIWRGLKHRHTAKAEPPSPGGTS